MATGHLLTSLLPLKSVKLGRLVLNAKRPHQDSIDPLAARPTEAELTRNTQSPFEETRKFSKSSTLRPCLGNILSFSYEKQNASVATLSAPQATTYDLNNSEAWFKSVCAQPDTRAFLESAIDDGRNVYLIVGFRTVKDARLTRCVTWKTSHGGKGKVPAQLVATSIISANIAARIPEPTLSGIRDIGNGQELAYNAPGEQVFAVLYRKVKFKWLSSRKIENMKLEIDNRWKSCWNWREVNSDDEEEDDMIEANLTDSDLDISDDEYTSEGKGDSVQEVPSPTAGTQDIEIIYGVPEGEEIPETNPTSPDTMETSDGEDTSGDGIGPSSAEPPSIASTRKVDKQSQSTLKVTTKRKRDQDGSDGDPKRVKTEIIAAEKRLRALRAEKKKLKRSMKRQRFLSNGNGARRVQKKPQSN